VVQGVNCSVVSAISDISLNGKKFNIVKLGVEKNLTRVVNNSANISGAAHIYTAKVKNSDPTSTAEKKATAVKTDANKAALFSFAKSEGATDQYSSEIPIELTPKGKTDIHVSVQMALKTSLGASPTSAKALISPTIQTAAKLNVSSETSTGYASPSLAAHETVDETSSPSPMTLASHLLHPNMIEQMATPHSSEALSPMISAAESNSVSLPNQSASSDFPPKNIKAKLSVNKENQSLGELVKSEIKLANKSNAADSGSPSLIHEQKENCQIDMPGMVFQLGSESHSRFALPASPISQESIIKTALAGHGVENAVNSEVKIYTELPEHQLSGTPSAIEVGVSGSTQGWLKVRAEITEDIVHATISSNSNMGQAVLHQQMSALNLYLQNEHIPATVSILSHGSNGSFAPDGHVHSQMEYSSQQEAKRDAQSTGLLGEEVNEQKEGSHPFEKDLDIDVLYYQVGAAHSLNVLA